MMNRFQTLLSISTCAATAWLKRWKGVAVPTFPRLCDVTPRAVSGARFKKLFISQFAPLKDGIVANMVWRTSWIVSSDHCEVRRSEVNHETTSRLT